jgi:SnoaL-like domain
MSSDAAALLAYVAQSPKLCAAHDRAGWIGLFATDGEVNDPVGSRPHRGWEAIERFYDTFIAPNALSFAVEHDVVCGMSVMRDLNILSVMSTGLRVTVPMHLRYDLVEEHGLKIARIGAHWELPAMLAQQLGSLNGWRTSLQLTPRLLAHQGIGGLIGFMRGLGGHGRTGKATASTFLAALAAKNARAAAAFVDENCAIEVPLGTQVGLPELAAGVRGLEWRKLIGAGAYASATIHLNGQRGVALFRFDHGPDRISGLQVFI